MKSTKFIGLLLAVNLVLSCNMEGQNWMSTGIRGEGPKVTKDLDIATFNGIGLSIDATVYVTQGNSQSVRVEAQQNIIDNLKREVKDGVWKITTKNNVRKHDGITIWITVKELSRIAVSGSGEVTGKNKFTTSSDLSLAVSGSGDIVLDANSKSTEGVISGSGSIKLSGNTGQSNFVISGSGDVMAADLASGSCSVVISGSGDVSVHAKDKLDVVISGSGDVYYKGNPNVKSKISGSGDVISK
jgi:hypothetical protein